MISRSEHVERRGISGLNQGITAGGKADGLIWGSQRVNKNHGIFNKYPMVPPMNKP